MRTVITERLEARGACTDAKSRPAYEAKRCYFMSMGRCLYTSKEKF